MKNLRHIHDVLNILYNTEQEFTVEELYNKLKNQYGNDVQFANCGDNILPIQEVVPFLLSRDKIKLSENTIKPMTPPCNH